MTNARDRLSVYIDRLESEASVEKLAAHLSATGAELPPAIRPTKHVNRKSLEACWETLQQHAGADDEAQSQIADPQTLESLEQYERNIESCIGTVKVPVGVIGPLRINGLHARGDFYVPLATTEASLVASYGRGARLISASGGCSVALLNDGLCRSPGFAFRTIAEAGQFTHWVLKHFTELKAAAESTTRHGRLVGFNPHMEGNHVYLLCEYTTGDASGQNMTTIATEALCRTLLAQCPLKPEYWFLEANFSGDKKASNLSFLTVRGKKVTAEVRLPAQLVIRYLHTDIVMMQRYWRMSALGGVMSGTMGVQGHYANGLAALYLATGQDVACVAESSIGVTRMEIEDDLLYASVTLPNIIVGTVGGGTGLPSQNAGLRLLGLAGAGKARALAEVCAAVCLAGELSLIGAICAGQFAAAHQALARERGDDHAG